jgi:hypothetical protein
MLTVKADRSAGMMLKLGKELEDLVTEAQDSGSTGNLLRIFGALRRTELTCNGAIVQCSASMAV